MKLFTRHPLSLALSALILGTGAEAASLNIDGKPDEAQWAQARRFDQFVTVQPFTQDVPRHAQTAMLLSLPEGLAIAFTIDHPPGLPRTKPFTQRDQLDNADRVNVLVDYDGRGRAAYNYTVALSGSIEDGVVGRNSFRNDWDGDWQYAVHETEHGWTVEMLIPWTVAAMDPPKDGQRTIGVYFDRVIRSSDERYAFPALRWSQSDMLDRMACITIPAYDASQTVIFPYASVLHDQIRHEQTTRAGVDVFYKNTSGLQVIGTLNPDFGQVESDDLVIDFSAIEVFFSDKRPFFTENNDFFAWGLPDSGQLLYTRRIGAQRDDGHGLADIDAAVKVNSGYGAWSVGYIAALEEDHDEVGRQFQALRNRFHAGGLDFGFTLLDTERPHRDRQATISAVDADWRPVDRWRLRSQFLRSDIETGSENAPVRHNSKGDGAWLTLDYTPSTDRQHSLELLNWGRDLELNDLGYLARNNLQQLQWESRIIQGGFDNDSRWREAEWTVRLRDRRNQAHRDLRDSFSVRSRFRDRSGGSVEFELVQDLRGYDDLIARGNGDWQVDNRTAIAATWYSPRRNDSAFEAAIIRGEEGLHDPYWQVRGLYRHWLGDRLTLSLGARYRETDDWIKWQQGTRFAQYARKQYSLDGNLAWFPAERHELRAKLQWLAISTANGRSHELQNGKLHAQNSREADFTLNNFGLQLRYRYKLGGLSDLFVVYSRGGYDEQQLSDEDPGRLFEDAVSLRTADQFLVKLRLQY